MITKKPTATAQEKPAPAAPDEAKLDAFIAGAPDSGAAPKATKSAKQNKVQISLTIDPDLLDRIDSRADKLGLARAAAISLACRKFLERGAVIEGDPEE